MIKLINVEESLQNALKTIGWYCKHNDCKTCGLKINDDTCLTDKDPDVWWMYLNAGRKDEPQYHADVECNYKDCDNCGHKEYCPQSKTEPQIDIHDLTDCDFCKDRNCKDCEGGKDEPQKKCHRDEEYACHLYPNEGVCNNCKLWYEDKSQTVSLTSAHISGDIYHKAKDEPQKETTNGLQLFADILFDKDKTAQFLEECKSIGIEP